MLVAYKSPVCSKNGVSKKGLAGLQFPSANGVVTRSNRALRGKGQRSAAKRPSQETHARTQVKKQVPCKHVGRRELKQCNANRLADDEFRNGVR